MIFKLKYFIFLVCLCLINGYVYPQLKDKTTELNKACFTALSQLKAGQEGKSPNGIPYKIYGIKDGSDWVLLIADTATFYSFRKTTAVDTLVQNSAFFDVNLCQLVQQKSADLKLKEKPVKVGDVSLASYYTLNSRSVRKFFNSFNEVETGKKKLSLVGKLIAPITNLFKIKPPQIDTKALQELANLKKQLDVQKKAFDELKKENDKLKEAMAKGGVEIPKVDNKNTPKNKDSLAKVENQPKDSLKKEIVNKEDGKKDTKKDNKKITKNDKKNNGKTDKKNTAKITNVANVDKTKNKVIFKDTGNPVQDSLRYQMDKIIFQIDARKEIEELQAKKKQLEEKKRDLEGKGKKEEPNQVSKKEKIEETIRIMESIDMIIVQMENKEMKKEFASKKIELQKKREELAAELRYLENEPEK